MNNIQINQSALNRLDDPTFLGLSPDAKWLFLKAYVWCERNGTKGRIPRSKIHEVVAVSPFDVIDAIAATGYWGDDTSRGVADFLTRVMA